MILGFKIEINKVPTNFVQKIIHKEKIHTIRNGNRWKPGHKIHMATGVRTKSYFQFNKGLDYLGSCISTQRIDILWKTIGTQRSCQVWIDGMLVNSYLMLSMLARFDGFDNLDSFFKWFNEDLEDGQIIHWTDFKYNVKTV